MNDNVYNLAFERSILSSSIFEPYQFEEVESKLNKDDFYLPAHQDIFIAMATLVKMDMPIDEEFIKKELIKTQQLDEQVMLEILMANPISNLTSYIDEAIKKSRIRGLLNLPQSIHSDIENNIDPSIIANSIIKILENQSYKSTPILSLQSLGDVKESETEFILKSWLPMPMGAVVFLTAKGGTGKSFIALQAGLRYLAENKDNRVFLWLSEDNVELSKYRASLIVEDYDLDSTPMNRLKVSSDMPVHFTELDQSKQKVTSAFLEVKKILRDYEFIVLDPLIAFYGGDENNNSQARYFMQLFTKWAIDENKVILFIHHSNKVNGGSRGAGAFIDAVRLNYEVEKIYDDKDKKNIAKDKRLHLQFTIAKDNYDVKRLIGSFEFERAVFPKERPIVVYEEVLDNEKYSAISN